MERAREIMDGYAALKVMLRRVMYRLAAEGVLPHTPPTYRRLSSQPARARREGRFPDLIVREVHGAMGRWAPSPTAGRAVGPAPV
ncbi:MULTISPECIES: hypothetical protein [unclassified Streptomyces]|uniref:hypothetical protein n=1 Tax=unclassified Streptomyces TaxID=2593676 RepID=UPI00364906F0